MAAQIPTRNDAKANAAAMERVKKGNLHQVKKATTAPGQRIQGWFQ